MAWNERKPLIGLALDTTVFNVLVDILNYHSQLELDDNNFAETARRLKEKLLTYSVPRNDEETGETYVDVRLFPNEASKVIYQLLVTNKPKENIQDYYSVLLENRTKRNND